MWVERTKQDPPRGILLCFETGDIENPESSTLKSSISGEDNSVWSSFWKVYFWFGWLFLPDSCELAQELSVLKKLVEKYLFFMILSTFKEPRAINGGFRGFPYLRFRGRQRVKGGQTSMKVIGWSKKWIFASIIGVRKTINLVFDQNNLVSGSLRHRQSISTHETGLSRKL